MKCVSLHIMNCLNFLLDLLVRMGCCNDIIFVIGTSCLGVYEWRSIGVNWLLAQRKTQVSYKNNICHICASSD